MRFKCYGIYVCTKSSQFLLSISPITYSPKLAHSQETYGRHTTYPFVIVHLQPIVNNETRKVSVLSKWSFVKRRFTSVNWWITVMWQFTSVNWQITVKWWFTSVKWQITVKQWFTSVNQQITVKWQFTSVKQRITVKWWFTSVNWQFTLLKYLIPGLQLFFS